MSENLTQEQIAQNDHIPTSEIQEDILDTEREIKGMRDELEVLMRNPPQNKVQIYFLEGGISKRKGFIENLNQILKHRIRLTQEEKTP